MIMGKGAKEVIEVNIGRGLPEVQEVLILFILTGAVHAVYVD